MRASRIGASKVGRLRRGYAMNAGLSCRKTRTGVFVYRPAATTKRSDAGSAEMHAARRSEAARSTCSHEGWEVQEGGGLRRQGSVA